MILYNYYVWSGREAARSTTRFLNHLHQFPRQSGRYRMYILSMYLTDLPVCLTDTERRRNTFDPIIKMLHDYTVTERKSKCGFVRNHLMKGKIPNQFIYFGSRQIRKDKNTEITESSGYVNLNILVSTIFYCLRNLRYRKVFPAFLKEISWTLVALIKFLRIIT